MTRGQMERALKGAGFTREERTKHNVWRYGDIELTVSKGLTVPSWAADKLRSVLRRVEKLRVSTASA